MIREIPEYFGGKRVGPGELPYVQNLGLKSSYDDKAKDRECSILFGLK